MSWGLEYWVSCFNKSVESCVFVDWSVCAIWWTVLLWRALWSLLMCLFEHVDSSCSHVSIVLFVYKVQFGFGCALGEKIIYDDCSCIGLNGILIFMLIMR